MKKSILVLIAFLIVSLPLSSQDINGVSIVGPFFNKENSTLNQLVDLNVNWISINPEATLDRKTLEFRHESNPNWTHDKKGYLEIIRDAKEKQQKILLKPHLVVGQLITPNDLVKKNVTWRGDINLYTIESWKELEERYRNYILFMAEFAEAQKIDMLCIGTELNSFIEKRPNYWFKLIDDIKRVYSGTLTYSANWDNYENIPFWNQLDYIGVNGYFPISNMDHPEVSTTIKRWNKIKKGLSSISKEYNKQILITEFGYRNAKQAGLEPWLHVDQDNKEIANQTQYNLLKAFFESIWQEEYIIGGFLWNWNYNLLPAGNTNFTVQEKPALELVKQYFEESL